MTWESEPLPEPPLDPARVDAIRRQAHAVLAGRVPARPPLVELVLVAGFSVTLLAWAVLAVVHPTA